MANCYPQAGVSTRGTRVAGRASRERPGAITPEVEDSCSRARVWATDSSPSRGGSFAVFSWYDQEVRCQLAG